MQASSKVTIRNDGTNGVVLADAMYFATPELQSIPGGPSKLTATPVSSTQVNLAWQINSNNEDGFIVEDSIGGTFWNSAGTAPSRHVHLRRDGLAAEHELLASCVHARSTVPVNPSNTDAGPVTTPPVQQQSAIVVDDDATGVTESGAWWSSSTNNGHFGADYINDGNLAKGSFRVDYPVTLPSGGSYSVYAWYPSGSHNATNVPIDIQTASGTQTATLNERQGGGQWVLLGTYNFTTGTTHVVIRNDGTNGIVDADAIEFVPANNIAPPAAPINFTAQSPSSTRADLAWTNVTAGSRYEIDEMLTNGGSWAPIATLDTNPDAGAIEHYSVTNLSHQDYQFRIRAVNDGGASANVVSNEVFPTDFINGYGVMDDSSSLVTYTGSWQASTTASAYLDGTAHFDNNANKGADTATFHIGQLGASGIAYLFVHVTWTPGSSDDVPVDVVSFDGSTTRIYIDETEDAPFSGWIMLSSGKFQLDASNAAIIIGNAGTTGNVYVDAVGFSRPLPG